MSPLHIASADLSAAPQGARRLQTAPSQPWTLCRSWKQFLELGACPCHPTPFMRLSCRVCRLVPMERLHTVSMHESDIVVQLSWSDEKDSTAGRSCSKRLRMIFDSRPTPTAAWPSPEIQSWRSILAPLNSAPMIDCSILLLRCLALIGLS